MIISPRWFVIGIPSFLVLIQFVGPQKTNPPIILAESIEAHVHLTPRVGQILKRSCSNCHSHETQWPWYSNVAPISWFVIDNVQFGRRKMNLSNWAQYDQEKTAYLLDAICEMTETGEMPLLPYLWMHQEGHLGEEDIRLICHWAEGEIARTTRGSDP